MEEEEAASLSNADFKSFQRKQASEAESHIESEGQPSHEDEPMEEDGSQPKVNSRRYESYLKWKSKQEEKAKIQADASKSTYRDRAAERRIAENLENNPNPSNTFNFMGGAAVNTSNLSYEASKFLGGDLEHTHLVKGLDYALLQKIKSDEQKLDQKLNNNDNEPSLTDNNNTNTLSLETQSNSIAARIRAATAHLNKKDKDKDNVEPKAKPVFVSALARSLYTLTQNQIESKKNNNEMDNSSNMLSDLYRHNRQTFSMDINDLPNIQSLTSVPPIILHARSELINNEQNKISCSLAENVLSALSRAIKKSKEKKKSGIVDHDDFMHTTKSTEKKKSSANSNQINSDDYIKPAAPSNTNTTNNNNMDEDEDIYSSNLLNESANSASLGPVQGPQRPSASSSLLNLPPVQGPARPPSANQPVKPAKYFDTIEDISLTNDVKGNGVASSILKDASKLASKLNNVNSESILAAHENSLKAKQKLAATVNDEYSELFPDAYEAEDLQTLKQKQKVLADETALLEKKRLREEKKRGHPVDEGKLKEDRDLKAVTALMKEKHADKYSALALAVSGGKKEKDFGAKDDDEKMQKRQKILAFK